jgi:Icc-related predicted phosphoesterase
MPLFGKEKSKDKPFRLFFATDVHSSQRVFEKFLSSAEHYKADALILGGDLTGKFVAPLIKQEDGTTFTDFLGMPRTLKTQEEITNVEGDVRTAGYYYFHTTQKEYEQMRDSKEKIDAIFDKLMLETLQQWVDMAEKKLSKTGVKMYVTGGNDDPFHIDDYMRSISTEHVVYVEGKIADVCGYEMASSGYSNMTPWKLPRDLDEDQLYVELEKLVSQVKDEGKGILCIHVPPYDTGMDLAIYLDKDLKYEHAGQPIEGPVGSHAVSKIIDKYQPLITLHGHIHESRCFYKWGRTMCFNPGSEYGEGILRGVIVILKGPNMEAYQFTSG